MRKYFLTLVALAGLTAFTAVPLVVLINGCTAPQQRIAVNTLFTTHTTVDGAFTSYMTLVLTGKVSTNGVPAAAQAYRDFQTAFNLAVEAVANNTNAPAPPAVTAAAAKVLAATH